VHDWKPTLTVFLVTAFSSVCADIVSTIMFIERNTCIASPTSQLVMQPPAALSPTSMHGFSSILMHCTFWVPEGDAVAADDGATEASRWQSTVRYRSGDVVRLPVRGGVRYFRFVGAATKGPHPLSVESMFYQVCGCSRLHSIRFLRAYCAPAALGV
jgi:hypothetical protein